MRISDWSSDVCASDLFAIVVLEARVVEVALALQPRFCRLGLQSLSHALLGLRSHVLRCEKDRKGPRRAPVSTVCQGCRRTEPAAFFGWRPPEKEIGRAHV